MKSVVKCLSEGSISVVHCICVSCNSVDLGYNHDLQTRAAFMEVLTKILQQGTEFDTLAETVLADRFEQLVQLATMISDKGELPIAMALANVVTTSQMVSVNTVINIIFNII